MAAAELQLEPGTIVWIRLDPTQGREQHGHRPALVVASAAYLHLVDSLAIVAPISSVDRGWDNHIEVVGLSRRSWVMTEQIRTVSRSRITSADGVVDENTLAAVSGWIGDFLV